VLTEIQLIKACQKGDKRAQYELVSRYSGKLMTVARRYVADNASAKDILQESLIKIFRNIHKYKATGSFEGWMRVITARCALDYLDKKHVKREVSTIDIGVNETTRPMALSNLGTEEIIELIQELPEGYRAVFNLNVMEGLPHKEIGKMLNITTSASRSQLSRAKHLLQQMYIKRNTKTKLA